MQISRRWNCIDCMFYTAVFLSCGATSLYGYYFLLCQTCPIGDEDKCCKEAYEATYFAVIIECFAQSICTFMPAFVLFQALRKMFTSQRTLFANVSLKKHYNQFNVHYAICAAITTVGLMRICLVLVYTVDGGKAYSDVSKTFMLIF